MLCPNNQLLQRGSRACSSFLELSAMILRGPWLHYCIQYQHSNTPCTMNERKLQILWSSIVLPLRCTSRQCVIRKKSSWLENDLPTQAWLLHNLCAHIILQREECSRYCRHDDYSTYLLTVALIQLKTSISSITCLIRVTEYFVSAFKILL